MTAGEIYGAMVLALLPSGKLVDITDINPEGVTMEQLEALPVVEDEQLMEEAVRMKAVDLMQRLHELQMQFEKMAYMEYREPLELEEQRMAGTHAMSTENAKGAAAPSLTKRQLTGTEYAAFVYAGTTTNAATMCIYM